MWNVNLTSGLEYLTSGSAEVYLAGPLGPSGQCFLYKGGQRDLDPPPPHTAAVTESAVYLTMKWYTGNNVKKRENFALCGRANMYDKLYVPFFVEKKYILKVYCIECQKLKILKYKVYQWCENIYTKCLSKVS